MIVADGQLNLAGLTVDDLYIVIVPPQTPVIAGVPTDGIGLVGTAQKGTPNLATPISTVQDLLRSFGDISLHANDLVTEAIGALKQGANNLWCIRVTDGSDTVGTKLLVDSAAATGVTFSGKSTGSWGAGILGSLGLASNNAAAYGSGTATISAVTTGNVYGLAVNALTAVSYVALSTDNPASVANALANLINNDAAHRRIVVATAANSVVTVRATTPGTVGNFAWAKSGTGSAQITLTPSGALTGGTGTATWRLVISSTYDVPEIFDNIAIGGFATIWTAIADAVNNGIVGIRGPSNIVTAVASAPAGIIIPQNLSGGTAGTDGRTAVTSGILIGTDGFDRTGMYGLRGLPIMQFGVAGLTDSSVWPNIQTFARDENYVAVLAFAKNSASLAAAQLKNALGTSSDDYRLLGVKDSLWLNDTKNSIIRQVSPIGAVLGKIATLSPERSPGNKPLYGYLGAEHTSYVNASGALVPAVPYSYAEMSLLETSGILFFTQPAVGGQYMALRHGQNFSSNATTNGINYSRMTIFLAKSLQGAMGFAVNEPHTRQLRQRVKTAISQFLAALANPGPGRQQMIGDPNGGPAFNVVCDETNNPSTLVAQGYLFCYVQVRYLSIVRFFVLSLEAGQSVKVQVQNSPVGAGV